MDSAVLVVRTETLPEAGELLRFTAAADPLTFLRGEDGLVGFGITGRWVFRGPRRIAEAAAAWAEVAAAARVEDAVQLPGTGLVAFGSFAFDDTSTAESVLVVPAVVVGRRDGVAWVTRITARDDETGIPGATEWSATDPTATELGAAPRVAFTPGAMAPERYRDAVAAAIAGPLTQALDKVVLARDLVGSLDPDADLRPPLAALRRAYPTTAVFAVEGLFGASPETLVRSSNGRVTARVLAGTAVPDAAGLLDSAKNLAEHRFAVETVVAGLAGHTVDLRAGDPFELALPNLTHLATDVSARLADASTALDLVEALHPTAAVAGVPTAEALAVIRALEPFDRGRYAGPVGWIDGRGDGEWAIALRCAQVADGLVTAFAGAGIVAASVPDTELAETELKFAPVRAALG